MHTIPSVYAVTRLQAITPTLDATVALLAAAGGDFRPLLEFGFELAPHPLGVTLYRGGRGAVVTTPPTMSKVEATVLSLTNAPAMASEAAYAAACLPDRLRCYAATLVLTGHHEQGEFTTLVREAADKLEAADALLSLSARYRAAHAAYIKAEDAATATLNQPAAVWAKARDAETALLAARNALLSAALDIT